MASINIAGDTSGVVTLQAPSVAGTTTLNLPATSGTVVTANGSNIISVSGVKFPSTQVPSADANCLDDYEEGTWTPVLNPAVGTITSQVTSGKYVKVGGIVTLTFTARITGGTVTSISSISGFPFVSSGDASNATRENIAAGQLWVLTTSNSATSASLINYINSSTVNNTYGWTGSLTYVVS